MRIADRVELESLVGKKVECCVTGLTVQGVVTEVKEDAHCYMITVDHKETPVNWGKDVFTVAYISQRKCDGFGSVKYLEIIEDSEADIRAQYAKQDVELLREESAMAITDTKLGVIWLTVESGVMIAAVDGVVLYQTAEINLMEDYLARQYDI
jgi:hypothetical protein